MKKSKLTNDEIEAGRKREGRICGAKRKHGRGVCNARPLANGRCRMHGGTSARGLAHHKFKTGRYSKYLPANILESINDPDLLNLRNEILLIDKKMTDELDIIKNIDDASGGSVLKTLVDKCRAFKQAIVENKYEDVQKIQIEIDKLVDSGGAVNTAWHSVMSLIEHRRRLVASIADVEFRKGDVVTKEQFMMFIISIVDIITRNVSNKLEIMAIRNAIEQRMHERDGALVK